MHKAKAFLDKDSLLLLNFFYIHYTLQRIKFVLVEFTNNFLFTHKTKTNTGHTAFEKNFEVLSHSHPTRFQV